ncbi:hypothetical protein V6V47_13570 [Micromonospora sp. CPCC 205539]|uniref:hypothetical protein n=1 Tax=Micromonospora sp. CPCC 205539 TaxID=3122408 RepID=UPI002FF181FD
MEITQLLQAGVTKPHPDQAASATWLALVHASTRAVGGVVTTSVEEPTTGRNHYRVGVRLRDGRPLSILFNAAALLVAGAERQDVNAAPTLTTVVRLKLDHLGWLIFSR